jgi:hypothetical protein
MLRLAELQEYFLKATLNKDVILNNYVCDHGVPGERRLQIYRNNFLSTLTDTLRSLYPCIVKLVGDDFFNQTARIYIQNYPSTSGNLHHYGTSFANFLATFSPAESLPYLPEMAQFEWGCHQVFHEVDAESLDIQKLTHIPAEQYPYLKLHLHPASRLYSFQYPILQIWKICQPDADDNETVDLSKGGVNLLIIRRKFTIEFEILSTGEYIFLTAAAAGQTFGDACAQALEVEPHINIAEILKKNILLGAIIAIH